MDTIKLNRQNTRIVAHRGASGLELENTCAAFVAAGNRSYFGVETDVHVTADGQLIIIHDDDTVRVSGVSMKVEQTDYQTLRQLQLKEKSGAERTDLRLPSLAEYLAICKRYEKVCVLELKNPMPEDTVRQIVEVCAQQYDLERMIFISFDFQNMLYLRKYAPDAQAQHLLGKEVTQAYIADLVANRLDLDIHYSFLTKELLDQLHNHGIQVNCWTVDDPACAEKLIGWGVDYLTSNILE